jgi:hypothetical protein
MGTGRIPAPGCAPLGGPGGLLFRVPRGGAHTAALGGRGWANTPPYWEARDGGGPRPPRTTTRIKTGHLMHFWRQTSSTQDETQSTRIEAGSICLVTGLTVSAVVAYQALPAQIVAGVTVGAAAAQTSHVASSGVKALTKGTWFGVDGAHRGNAALPQEPTTSFSQLPTWPEADIDSLSSTDFEDLAVFAADVFEFIQQEYAMLVATYGESRLATFGGAALWALVRMYRAISSARRLK